MRHILFPILLLGAISLQARPKSIALPPVSFANTRTLEITRVNISDTATVVEFEAFSTPGFWIKIVSDTYLATDGKKYMIRSGEGIQLDSLFWMPESGKASFKLSFEALPRNTKNFDFIESDCAECFKLYGVDISGKRRKAHTFPAEFTQRHNPESDFSTSLQKGKATISGRFIGYRPAFGDAELIYTNPILGENRKQSVKIAPDGSFNTSVTVYSATHIGINLGVAYSPIRVAPGKESKIQINLPELYRSGSRLLRETPSYGDAYAYAGYFAALNTDMNNKRIIRSLRDDHSEAIAGMDANTYKQYMMQACEQTLAHNASLNISPMAKSILSTEAAFDLRLRIERTDNYLIEAYARKNKLSLEEARSNYKASRRPADFDNFYRLLPFSNPDFLLLPQAGLLITQLSYSGLENITSQAKANYLLKQKISEQDRKVLEDFIRSGNTESTSSDKVFAKYRSELRKLNEDQCGVNFLAKYTNEKESLLLTLLKAQRIMSSLREFTPLTEAQKQEIASFPPCVREVLTEQNDKLLAKIEENKRKTGFTVLDVPKVSNEALLVEILKPFKGKVVLIDIWATWCSPCRIANKAMEPLKTGFAGKEVVFLYLAGENSPEAMWKNMITDMKGYHCRMSDAQWAYLRDSLNAKGVPTYVIIDRKGKQSFYSLGFPGEEKIRSELLNALGK